jgi:hypothetical protein
MHQNEICKRFGFSFLFKDSSEDSPIKIIDFGMASTIHQRQHLSKLCGTRKNVLVIGVSVRF